MAKIKKRADGRYKVSYSLNGKRKYFYGATRAEALSKREEFVITLKKAPNMDESITLTEWLDEYLLDAKSRVARATYVSYERICRLHLVPALGANALVAIQPAMIREFLANKSATCSSRSVEYMYIILKAALTLAVNDGVIYRNPAASVQKPKVTHKQSIALSVEQVRALLAAIDDNEFRRLIYVTVTTGLRREEVLALRTQDVNVDNGAISVIQTLHYDNRQVYITQTTKTAASRRVIALDNKTLTIVKEQLTAVKKRQKTTFGYNHDLKLLFATEDGNPLFPSWVSKRLQKYAKKAGIPDGFTFHGLRHTHATLLLESGANYKAIQARLGHSSFKTTMDVYSHVTQLMEADILNKISEFA